MKQLPKKYVAATPDFSTGQLKKRPAKRELRHHSRLTVGLHFVVFASLEASTSVFGSLDFHSLFISHNSIRDCWHNVALNPGGRVPRRGWTSSYRD